MRINFEIISVKATKRWKDVNGKSRQKTKTFWQTVNPFNKDKDGNIKAVDQIYREITAERDTWLNQPENNQ